MTLGSAVFVSVVILGWQRMSLVELRESVTVLRARAVDAGPPTRQATILPGVAESSDAHHGNPDTAGDAARDALPSVHYVKAQADLMDVLQRMEGLERSPAAAFRMMPEILGAVENLTVDELITLAKEMRKISDPSGDPHELGKMVLVMLAAEHAPGRVLEDEGLVGGNIEIRAAALGALAKEDPAAARRWLEESDPDMRDERKMSAAVAMRLFREDPAQGLDFIRSMDGEQRVFALGGLGVYMKDPAGRRKILQALEVEKDVSLRTHLGGALVKASLVQGNLEDAKTALDELPIEGEARDEVLSNVVSSAMNSDPAGAIEWLLEESGADQREERIAGAIQAWAHLDYNAAGEWLGLLEASPEKDAAISAFADSVAGVDPEAALAWAGEMQDSAEREQAQRKAIRQWAARDREAAAAWLDKQGLPAEDWLEKAE